MSVRMVVLIKQFLDEAPDDDDDDDGPMVGEKR